MALAHRAGVRQHRHGQRLAVALLDLQNRGRQPLGKGVKALQFGDHAVARDFGKRRIDLRADFEAIVVIFERVDAHFGNRRKPAALADLTHRDVVEFEVRKEVLRGVEQRKFAVEVGGKFKSR